MELRYISIKCPICGSIWGRTEEYASEQIFDEAEEVNEYRLCPTCRGRKRTTVSKGSSFDRSYNLEYED